MGQTGPSSRAGGNQKGTQLLVSLLFLACSCASQNKQGSWDLYTDEQLKVLLIFQTDTVLSGCAIA